ncbi:hypothetical protein DPMN_183154 [Dreissena polymorpha]|uniref:Transposase n=1 Tax=Dreissena polymorpha TaxID=45954 RepID=A0A9D4I5B0_DREPO|nr:hypothetical protein DPMN_183154 [Dreissena polymorpha]
MRPILRELVEKAKYPFRGSTHELLSCNDDCPCTGEGRFPTLPKLFHRGSYVLDNKNKTSDSGCRQKGFSHPSLTPGLFTISCVHGICYGFHIMEDVESPNIPFTIMRTRFNTAPKLVIYDNACNLHKYCLNRDHFFFRDSWCVVDRFHWVNHAVTRVIFCQHMSNTTRSTHRWQNKGMPR